MSDENKKHIQRPILIKKRWYVPYVIAGLIFGSGASFARTLTGGEFILAGAAIGVSFFYYPLKSKIKIKNKIVRIIVVFLILDMAAGILVGSIGGLITRSLSNSEYHKKMINCQDYCNFNPRSKIWIYTAPEKKPTTKEGARIDELAKKYGLVYVPKIKYFQTQKQCLSYCLAQ